VILRSIICILHALLVFIRDRERESEEGKRGRREGEREREKKKRKREITLHICFYFVKEIVYRWCTSDAMQEQSLSLENKEISYYKNNVLHKKFYKKNVKLIRISYASSLNCLCAISVLRMVE
jgi:hypothetical protein